MPKLPKFASSLLIATMVATTLVACGGGGSSSTPAPAPTPTPSGPTALSITDNTVGTGATATGGATLTVAYTGWLYDASAAGNKGTSFDSSTSFKFVLGTGQVIKGWDQGLVGMKLGGTRTLIIPSSLAYGASANGPIPANSALVFTVQLLNVQ